MPNSEEKCLSVQRLGTAESGRDPFMLSGAHNSRCARGAGYCLRDPGSLGGEVVWGPGQPRPTHPPTHITKIFLWQKMKFIKGAGNLRLILGTFYWPLVSP